MSEPEDFLARWSRRKREREADAAAEAETCSRGANRRAEADIGRTMQRAARPGGRSGLATPEPEFDLASLPSIESITAATDIRAFLRRACRRN